MYLKLYTISLIILCCSCDLTSPETPQENTLLDGPLEGLSYQNQKRFLNGDEAFGEVFTTETGLGPLFIASSCISCHPGDGKGTPFVEFTRFGQSDTTGNKFLEQGAPQLQHKAIPGYEPESLPTGATFTKLIAPAVTGLGFLDAVSDQTLINLSDPNDKDGDGISGRPHWNTIPEYVKLRPNTIIKNNRYITRFGKKAGSYNLLHQTVGAYNEDMGISSFFEAKDPFTQLEIDPEITNETVYDVVFYLKTLKYPTPREEDNAEVLTGKQVFINIDCGKCHIPSLTTGESNINVLNFKEFHPYTDLLLHDMGADLNDGYTEGFALPEEWKTPPLWGLGLSTNSQGGQYLLLHDGRANSIEEAILFHGGEAENSKNNYLSLSESEKISLIKFLESL